MAGKPKITASKEEIKKPSAKSPSEKKAPELVINDIVKVKNKVQTAEGWKREMKLLHHGKKKRSED